MACHNRSVIVSCDDIWRNGTSSAGMYEDVGIVLLRVTSPTFKIFCLCIAGYKLSRYEVVEEPVVGITILIHI